MQLLVSQLPPEKVSLVGQSSCIHNVILDYYTVQKKKKTEGKLQTILHTKVTSKQDLSAIVRLKKSYTYNSEGFPFTQKTC